MTFRGTNKLWGRISLSTSCLLHGPLNSCSPIPLLADPSKTPQTLSRPIMKTILAQAAPLHLPLGTTGSPMGVWGKVVLNIFSSPASPCHSTRLPASSAACVPFLKEWGRGRSALIQQACIQPDLSNQLYH